MGFTASEAVYLFRCTATFISSLLCLGIIAGCAFRRERIADKALLRTAIFYFAMVAGSWLMLIFYRFAPTIYVHVNAMLYLSVLLVQVLLYHLVFWLTGTGSDERFSWIHYAIPVVIAVVFEVWSLAVPFHVRLAIVTTFGEPQPGYVAYSYFFTSRLQLRGVYSIIYLFLCVVRLRRYRQVVGNYSADFDRSSLRWVQTLLILAMLIVPTPIAAFFASKQALVHSLIFLLPSIFIVIQHGILTYHLLLRSFVIIMPNVTHAPAKRYTVHNLTRASFEAYIKAEKPYLDPDMKITTLMTKFATNRSYLSDFINREYGVNFSRFINILRLAEFERLSADPVNAGRNKTELVLEAGFSSYSGYWHFVRSKENVSQKVRHIYDSSVIDTIHCNNEKL